MVSIESASEQAQSVAQGERRRCPGDGGRARARVPRRPGLHVGPPRRPAADEDPRARLRAVPAACLARAGGDLHDGRHGRRRRRGSCRGGGKCRIGRQLRLLPAMAGVFKGHLPRVLKALMALEGRHPREPHYYLAFIGVEPEWQGRGLGGAVLAPVLERCDAEGMPAFLEASTPRNRALYERHRFTVTEEFTLGRGAPPQWRMWREPRATRYGDGRRARVRRLTIERSTC